MKKWMYLLALPLLSMSKPGPDPEMGPVIWSYSVSEVKKDLLEVHFVCELVDGWHIYAMKQESKVGAIPTSIVYFDTDNPVFDLQGRPKETGTMVKFKDDSFGPAIVLNEFFHKAEFIQVVHKKAVSAGLLTGTIRYQACNGVQCLRPVDQPFAIPLQAKGTTILK
jgi:hypothetical protein